MRIKQFEQATNNFAFSHGDHHQQSSAQTENSQVTTDSFFDEDPFDFWNLHNKTHTVSLKMHFIISISIILLVLYIVDTCVLCSGCSLVQWVVNLANIDLIAASGANQTLNNTTGIIHPKQTNLTVSLFLRWGNYRNTSI